MGVFFVRYVPLMELPVLLALVLYRAALLRRQGVKALVFGVTDKSDFLLIPVIASFFYALLASIFTWPFPAFLIRFFWQSSLLNIAAIIICALALVCLAATLKAFGRSFRVGIDEKTTDKLVTTGTFAFSRNPIYVAFLTFFLGMFLAYPSLVTTIFWLLLAAAIHRQILREEKFLQSHYGQEYTTYCTKVRRYL